MLIQENPGLCTSKSSCSQALIMPLDGPWTVSAILGTLLPRSLLRNANLSHIKLSTIYGVTWSGWSIVNMSSREWTAWSFGITYPVTQRQNRSPRLAHTNTEWGILSDVGKRVPSAGESSFPSQWTQTTGLNNILHSCYPRAIFN